MPALSYYSNVHNTALVILRNKGFRVWSQDNGHTFFAEKEGWDLLANDPVQLLGLVSILETQRPATYKDYWWKIDKPWLLGDIPTEKPEFTPVWKKVRVSPKDPMPPTLPPPIAAFFHAHNTGQTAAFLSLFTSDAVVSDDQHEYRGAAIKEWIDGAIAKYKPLAEVTGLTESAGQTLATAQVSGNFPGSPTQLRYKFTLKDGRIAALAIGP